MKCSICEKEIYGHPKPQRFKRRVNGQTVMEDGPVVCGSCPLQKTQGGATGKSFSEVRMDLAKVVTKKAPNPGEVMMTTLKVKSNVPNRTILLDGRHPVVFGKDGTGSLKPALRELFEREMMMKPGRFSFVVEEESPVAPVEPVVEVLPVVEEVAQVAATEEVPADLDQSFLAEEPVKPVKASKKK